MRFTLGNSGPTRRRTIEVARLTIFEASIDYVRVSNSTRYNQSCKSHRRSFDEDESTLLHRFRDERKFYSISSKVYRLL